LPTDEVKNSDHFINQAELKIMQRITFGAAKIASEHQMKEKVSGYLLLVTGYLAVRKVE